MKLRAETCVFWPGINSDIESKRKQCIMCDVNTPSQPRMPATIPRVPDAPFQCVAADYFSLGGHEYLVTVDRFSKWPDVRETPSGTDRYGSKGLIRACRELFATFGVPVEMSTDGGPQYKAGDFADFFRTWGVSQRMSSAYFAQSNGRAEVAVKSVKRMLRDNMGTDGTLDTDAVMRGLLLMRNQPDRDTGMSPAMVVMGRPLRDSLPLKPPLARRMCVFETDSPVASTWKNMWADRETALRKRLVRHMEDLDAHSRKLPALKPGDRVRIQNQTGSNPTKWDRTGEMVQVGDHDQPVIRVDGSRQLTKRNRRFLRKFECYEDVNMLQVPRMTPTQGASDPVLETDGQAAGCSPVQVLVHDGDTSTRGMSDTTPRTAKHLGLVQDTTHEPLCDVVDMHDTGPGDSCVHDAAPESLGLAVEDIGGDRGVQPGLLGSTPVRSKGLRLLKQLEDYNNQGIKEPLAVTGGRSTRNSTRTPRE